MQNNFGIQLPWVNPDGTFKTLSQLKIESQKWTFSQWEKYLMFIEYYGREDAQSTYHIDQTALEDFVSCISKTKRSALRPKLQRVVRDALKKLSPKELEVYKLIFVKDLSLQDASKRIGVSKQAIAKRRDRLFKKVRETLLRNEIERPYLLIKKIPQKPFETKYLKENSVD